MAEEALVAIAPKRCFAPHVRHSNLVVLTVIALLLATGLICCERPPLLPYHDGLGMASPVDFGGTEIGHQAVKPLVLTNIGDLPLSVFLWELTVPRHSDGGEAPFTFATDLPAVVVLQSGDSYSLPLAYLPTTMGPDNAVLSIDTDSVERPMIWAPVCGYGLLDGGGGVPTNEGCGCGTTLLDDGGVTFRWRAPDGGC
jgi:hypothetical protein